MSELFLTNVNKDGDTSMDEYIDTAIQIFDCCGVKSSGTLRVNALMDKFAPFVKTNKAEYSYLRSLLDPEQTDPEITVTKLATALNEYSQKIKVDLDESFNLKSGQAPHDSDSGISTDGFQLLEDLQCELREKSHLAIQLRSQLDFTDRQHEEALATLSAELDSLRTHLTMLREENITLTHVRRDYEEVCERLGGSERALDDARRELETVRKRSRALHEQRTVLENEKLTLQEQLTKSKDECHRINEMYASRQAKLLLDNETLRAEHAELSARFHDQKRFLQQIVEEKARLEIELKEMLNKSNQLHLPMDRSIDVSYTEDQMLTALDSLNADSRFSQENHILDDESFANALKEDQGRATNISLFDEIRLSFCNMSRHNMTEHLFPEKSTENHDNSLITVATQTDEGYYESELNDTSDRVENHKNRSIQCQTENQLYDVSDKVDITINRISTQCQTDKSTLAVAIQTETNDFKPNLSVDKIQYAKNASNTIDTNATQTHTDNKDGITIYTQTDIIHSDIMNNNVQSCRDCSKCVECEKLRVYSLELENEVKSTHETMSNVQKELEQCEDNLRTMKQYIDESNYRNKCLQETLASLKSNIDEGNERNKWLEEALESLKSQLVVLECTCREKEEGIERTYCETYSALVQTESEVSSVCTQTELPCSDCVKRKSKPSRRLKKYLWEPLKWLFQMFAIVCFVCAVCALYGVTKRSRPACREREPNVPWRWLDAQDLMDLLLSIEYVADVPM